MQTPEPRLPKLISAIRWTAYGALGLSSLTWATIGGVVTSAEVTSLRWLAVLIFALVLNSTITGIAVVMWGAAKLVECMDLDATVHAAIPQRRGAHHAPPADVRAVRLGLVDDRAAN